jgi:hypothetical protein
MGKELTMRDIHDALVGAGRPEPRPIGVCGAPFPPRGAVSVAAETAENIERSFVGKLPGMACPEERENIFS